MDGFSNKTPHFFQPLLRDFQSNFSIPKEFLNKYLGKEMKEQVDGRFAILSSKKADKIWLVKMGFDDDDNDKLRFTKGWKQFCEEYGLQIGDFLVFMHHRSLVFDVFVFDPSGCERPFRTRNDDHHSKRAKTLSLTKQHSPANIGFSKKVKGSKRLIEERKVCSKSKVNFTPSEFPYCHTSVKEYCLKWGGMLLPRTFARENGLTKRWCDITLIDEKGEEHRLQLRHRKQNSGGSVYIGKWRDFQKNHFLNTDDPVVFELIATGENPVFKFYSKLVD